jgi:hypothetical protein
MKTAMQELFDEMTSINWHLYSYEDKIKIINVHLEKEKEQIIDAYADGIDHDYTDLDKEFGIANSDMQNHGEKYYNQTYNNEKLDNNS